MAFLDKMFIFVFIFIMIFAFIGNTAQHEFAHKTFNDKYGVESEYFIDFPWAAGVKSYGEQPPDLKLLHGMNEVVNYNLAPFLMSIIALIGLGFWFIGNKLDNMFEEFKQKGITIQQLPAKKEIELDKTELV